jgi:hypothetical protein
MTKTQMAPDRPTKPLPEAFATAKARAAARGVPKHLLDAATYRKAYNLALDGKLPTIIVNGRHRVPVECEALLDELLGFAPHVAA